MVVPFFEAVCFSDLLLDTAYDQLPSSRPHHLPSPIIHGFGGYLFTGPILGIFKIPPLQKEKAANSLRVSGFHWLREQDLNLRSSGYEPDEIPDFSIPRLDVSAFRWTQEVTVYPNHAQGKILLLRHFLIQLRHR